MYRDHEIKGKVCVARIPIGAHSHAKGERKQEKGERERERERERGGEEKRGVKYVLQPNFRCTKLRTSSNCKGTDRPSLQSVKRT